MKKDKKKSFGIEFEIDEKGNKINDDEDIEENNELNDSDEWENE